MATIPVTTTPDYIGRIPVPLPVDSGLTFPLVTEYGYGMIRDWKIVEHRFGELATLAVQRYSVGSGARRFQFVKSSLSFADRQNLLDFYDSVQGSYQSFTYPVPRKFHASGDPPLWDTVAFDNYKVVFENAPLSITDLANRVQTGITFLEVVDPASAPSGTVTDVVPRFPPDYLAKALALEVQTIVPLVHIKLRNPAVPDIYLSDRRCNVTGFPGAASPQTFLPRLLNVGLPGTSDVIMSQNIDGRSENVRFVFGNADRAMSQLVNDSSIEFAQIDLSLFHFGTGALIQLWKGLILSWQIDGSPQMSVQCSDGLYPITLQYPPRVISHQCWKPFDHEILPGYKPCPFTESHGPLAGGKTDSCDYFFNSPNGCLAHGMSNYFGGHYGQPQIVMIQDNGTGNWFTGHPTIISTSILSDAIFGQTLADIWCNSFGNPQRAFWTQCFVAAVRDEVDYTDLLGVVGSGPIGGFEGMSVQTNADGYKFVVAPTADGFYPQGFKISGDLNLTPPVTGLGLRQSVGNDPAMADTSGYHGVDSYCLGQGTPQFWGVYDPNFSNTVFAHIVQPYAAGTALCEIRYPKAHTSGGIQPTTAESHNMQVPLRLGLVGAVFSTTDDLTYTRTLKPGVVNPFWVAANTYLRALSLQQADAATQQSYLALDSITNTAGMGCADIADLWVDPVVGTMIPMWTVTTTGGDLPHYNLDLFNNTFSWQTIFDTTKTITIDQAIAAGYIIQSNPTGQEPQFQFQGALQESKPFRDWMMEILNCALGWFCFEFGRLKMGIRYSAVPTDAFTVGGMLYQSLTIAPIAGGGRFDQLRLNFANVEFQFQEDYGEYCDKDHAAYFGRAGSPLTSAMRNVGCSTLSQALRLCTTRVREEVGGIMRGVPYNDASGASVPDVTTNKYIEWDNNKRITFQSTLLALTCEIGDVIAVQHPDLPTYPGAHPASRAGSNGPFQPNTWPFRIKQWQLHSDWSVTITADSCVDSMYDLEVGKQPKGVGPRPLPVLFYPEVLQQWAPYQIQADANDPLWPNEFNFNLGQKFQYQADGTLLTTAEPSGVLPVNVFVPNCGAPDIKQGGVSWSDTGGFIPGGTTVYAQVCAAVAATIDGVDTVLSYSPPSEILILKVPVGTDTNAITISKIHWPNVAALNAYVLFIGVQEDMICGQESGDGLPTSITFNGPVQRQTYAVPDFDIRRLRMRATVLIHGGVVGAFVQQMDSTSITCSDTVDLAGTDDWSGRVLAIIGRQLGDRIAPWSAFNITAFNAATGKFTLDRDPTAAYGTPPQTVALGDFFVVCTKGVDNSSAPNVITEHGMKNATNIPPHSGETVNDPNRIGRVIKVIKGKSRGMSAKIISNTIDSYTLDRDLPIDATSVWVLIDPGWQYSKDVVINNVDPSQTTISPIEVSNYRETPLLVEGVTINSEGEVIDDTDACVRMLYIPGVQGTQTLAALP